MKKYRVDQYGNISTDEAQWDYLDKRWMFNPEKESLVDPGKAPEGKRFNLKNETWEIIDIDVHHKKLENGIITNKSLNELMRDLPDEFPTPKGLKLVEVDITDQNPDGLILQEKTTEEKYKDGEISKEEANFLLKRECDSQRQLRYIQESDPLFFKWQRKESSKDAWLKAVKKIKEEIKDPELFG